MRCFVALDVSDAIRALALRIRESIAETNPAWQAEKWVALENLHVTLAFLGDVKHEDVRALAASLRANCIGPFTLGEPAVDAVPRAEGASMIWVRYQQGSQECASLAAVVRDRAAGLGIVPDLRPQRFIPHVTLVRARRRRSVSEVALETARELLDASSDQSVSVSSVRVFSSSLGQVGPTYTEIERVPLLGAPIRESGRRPCEPEHR